MFGTVVGTPDADEFHWGMGGDTRALNLNPGVGGDEDVDVTASGTFASLMVRGRAGDDTIIPAPGVRMETRSFSRAARATIN